MLAGVVLPSWFWKGKINFLVEIGKISHLDYIVTIYHSSYNQSEIKNRYSRFCGNINQNTKTASLKMYSIVFEIRAVLLAWLMKLVMVVPFLRYIRSFFCLASDITPDNYLYILQVQVNKPS